MFIDGHALDFERTRNGANVLEFVKETTGESLDELPTLDEIKEFLEEFPVALVLFVDSVFDKSLKVFNVVSKIYQDIAFGYTNSAEARVKSGKQLIYFIRSTMACGGTRSFYSRTSTRSGTTSEAS